MKRFLSSHIVIGVIAVVLSMLCPASARAQYYMNVFRNDGARVLFDVAAVDSVRLQNVSAKYQLVIYADYSRRTTYFNTSLIDSISYRTIDQESEAAFYSINTISDNTLLYDSEGWAIVRFVTTPRNLLLNNENVRLRIFDTSGSSSSIFTVGDKEFCPADSSWQLKVRINSTALSECTGAVTLTCNDIIAISNTFTLKKVTIKMKSIRITGGETMKYDSKSHIYSACLPTTTDFSAQRMMFTYTGDSVTVAGKRVTDGKYNSLDARDTMTVSVWAQGICKNYYVTFSNTGLPVVRIDTKGKSVTRRDTWVEGATMRIELPDGTVDFEGGLSLKGRGNGTWTETDKKPYAIKLDEKSKILGMHKNKRWILLANYKDRTLMRNDVALWLSRQTEMPYTVSGQFVELVWNGEHRGNYYLCEQAKIDKHRIDIHDPNLDEPAKGGIFMEIDAFLDYTSSEREDKGKDIGFWSSGSNRRYNLPYIFKDPDESEIDQNSATYKYMVDYVNKMETAIYSLKTKPNDKKWREYLDMDRAVDYALIQEITMNHDCYNTWPVAGPHSGLIYKDSAGPICFGPCWDYDYHTFTLKEGSSWGGSSDSPRLKQWELLKMDNKENNKYYFSDLVKYDPEFKARLVELWNQYKNVWKEGFPAYVDEVAEKIRLSESYNWTIWGLNNPNGNQNGDENLSFQQAVDNIKEAFLKRRQWIDENLPNL